MIAAKAGADYLGFIFYPPSPRAVNRATAYSIITHLRQNLIEPPLMVGVFVNETAESIANTLDQCCLDLAQLSGDELPSLIGDSQSPIYGRAYKAIRPASVDEAEAEAQRYMIPRQKAEGKMQKRPSLLVDTFHPTLRGGTGLTLEWGLVRQLIASTPGIMLAGGLRPNNVAAAVTQLKPFAVDVASGVESHPGKKDHDQVRDFITNAKQAILARHDRRLRL